MALKKPIAIDTSEDSLPETPMNPNSDEIPAYGFYVQVASGLDTAVGLYRDVSNNLVLKDPVSGTKTLAQILAGGSITAPYTLGGVGDTVPFTINGINGQTAKLQSWKVAAGEVAFVAASGAITAPGFTGPLTGNASSATQLQTSRNINGVAFNGTANINVNLNNAVTFNSSGGAAAGTTFDGSTARTIDYATVGAAAANHTHSYQAADQDLLAIAGLSDTAVGFLKKTAANTWTIDTATYQVAGSYQPLDADLTAIAGLVGTSGFLKKTAADTWQLDTNSYQASNNELSALAALVDTVGFVRKTGDGSYTIDTTSYAPVNSPTFTGDVTFPITNVIRIGAGKFFASGDGSTVNYLFSGGTSGLIFRNAANSASIAYLSDAGVFNAVGGLQLNGSNVITAGNIGSQSVNYAATAPWSGISGKPTALSSFTNDLGNYGGWITASGSITGDAGSVNGQVFSYVNTSNDPTWLWGTNTSGTSFLVDPHGLSVSAASAVPWTGVTGRPTALSSFTNDLGNYGGFLTSASYASATVAGAIKVGTNLSINASGVLSATGGGTPTVATSTANATYYPVFHTSSTNGSNLAATMTPGAFYFNPATGILTATDFTATSDARLKENVETLTGSLAKILSLRGVSYTFKSDESKRQRIGFIAQEVEKVFPEAISKGEEDGMLSVSYGQLVAPLIEAVREQQALIEKQQAQIDELTALVKRLVG